jgi:hypothetical protein
MLVPFFPSFLEALLSFLALGGLPSVATAEEDDEEDEADAAAAAAAFFEAPRSSEPNVA